MWVQWVERVVVAMCGRRGRLSRRIRARVRTASMSAVIWPIGRMWMGLASADKSF